MLIFYYIFMLYDRLCYLLSVINILLIFTLFNYYIFKFFINIYIYNIITMKLSMPCISTFYNNNKNIIKKLIIIIKLF